jgi:hypothetical protein
MQEPQQNNNGSNEAPNWLKFAFAFPVILAYVVLGALVIWQATQDPIILENVVALIGVLGIFTAPAMKILDSVFRINGD